MFHHLKKLITVITAAATILWAMGAPMLPLSIPAPEAQAASVAVQFQGCGTNMTDPCFRIPFNGSVVPASSQPTALFSFRLKKTSTATFASVKVNLVAHANATSIAANHFGSLRVYKQTSFTGGTYAFPDNERIDDGYTVIQDFTDVGGVKTSAYSITIAQTGNHADGTAKNSIASDFWQGGEYLVAFTTSAGWTGTDQIRYGLPVNWITLSDGTLGSVYTYPSESNDWYYATQPDNFMGEKLDVGSVDYISGTEVDIMFMTDVEQTSAETEANYKKIGDPNVVPTSAVRMTPRNVRLNFSGQTITANQTQIKIHGPNGVAGGIKSMSGSTMTSDQTRMVMGGGGMGGASLVISEVMIGQAGTNGGKKEFVEIHNTSSGQLNLGDMGLRLWSIYNSGSTLTQTKITDLTGTIPANGYYLIASAEYNAILTEGSKANKEYTDLNAEGAIKPNAGIYINNSNTFGIGKIDQVGWGTATGEMSEGQTKCEVSDPAACAVANDGKSLERKANNASTAVSMNTGGADVNFANNFDSQNNQFDFIQRATAQPQNASSTAETPGGAGFGAANNPPNIFHQPLFMGVTGNDLIIMADIADDSGELSSSNTKLIYRDHDADGAGANTAAGTWQEASGVKMGPGSFKFTIVSASLDAAKDIDYYLKATDGTKYTCMPVSCNVDTGALVSGTSNYIDITATSGTRVISGFVKDTTTTGAGINGVMVMLAGSPFTTTTTNDNSGQFTISGVSDGIYRLEAKGGSYTSGGVTKNYMSGWIDGISVNSNNATSSNNTIVLVEGMGGQGGDRESPMVMWSAPNDQMMGAPTKIDIHGLNQIEAPIMLGFSKAMDSTTINSTNITLKYTTASGLSDPHSICVAYQSQGQEAQLGSGACARTGVTSVNFGPDQKAVIYSATPLEPNKQYVIELTGAVKDSAGNPLQGARPGGGHVISFTTSAGDFMGMYGGTAQNTTFVDKYGATQQFGTQAQQVTNFASGGDMMPPYVQATIPSPGARNVPKDTNIVITFSEPMDPSSLNAGTIKVYDTNYNNTGTGQDVVFLSTAISLDNSKTIATVDLPSDLSPTDRRYAIRVTGGARSAKGIYITKPDSGYESRIMFQADFEVGASNDETKPTVQGTNLLMYESSGVITGVPNSIGVIDIGFSEDMDPGTINTATITLKSGTSTVASTVAYDTGSRSARVMPSSVLYTNTQYTLTVESGSSGAKAINGDAAHAYNQIASDYTQNFTTSSSIDTEAPRVNFANGDDYRIAITFSESMKAVTAVDANNWANSILNPANYIFYTDNNPPPSGSTALYFGKSSLSQVTDSDTGGPLTFKYDAPTFTVVIEGLRLLQPTIHGGFRIFTRNIKDLSGNVITDGTSNTSALWTPTLTDGKPNTFGPNAAGGGVMNSATSFGNIGPGGGGMMGPPTAAMMAGGAAAGKGMVGGQNQAQDFGGKNVFDMGFKPIGVWPMNMQAGATSMYMIDIPLTQALSSGDKIVLTFPQGFNVAGAKSGDPNNKFAHQDINGPGPGTVRLKTSGITEEDSANTRGGSETADGVTVNTQGRTVTLHLNITGSQTTTGTNDFLHFEIDGIVNGQTAKDFNTAGYTVDIKTQSGTRVLESKTSMPFFLQPKGSIALTVTVNFKNADGLAANVSKPDVKVFLMSPMAGPLKQSANFVNASSTAYTFSNLNAGMYQLMTDPVISVGSTDYYSDRGDPRPFDIAASNSNCTGSACTATVNLQAESTDNRPKITVYLMGTFATDDIDIFAGGPGGFRVKTIENVDGTCNNTNVCSYTLSLPGTGKYMIGMGPAMPKGADMMGPPPMPDWMPPRPQEVTVSGSGTWTWVDSDGAATADANDHDGIITIDISGSIANKTITGYVCKTVNAGGTACATDGHVSNAEIFANSPMGGFGTHASSNSSDGSFTLRVQEGSFKVGAFLPGMPPSQEKSVEVRGSSMYINGVLGTSVILKVQVPDYTISGTVTDSSNKIVKGAGVYAYRTNGQGHADSMTDSTGKYILYVNPGAWTVGAFIPGYGQLPQSSEISVTISTESATNQNLQPPTASETFDFITIQDRVFEEVNDITGYQNDGAGGQVDDTPLSGVHVVAQGANYVNDAITDSSGLFSLTLPTDPSGANLANYQYDIKAWSPTLGKLPLVDNFSSATSKTAVDAAAPIIVPDTKTVTVNFINASSTPVVLSEAFIQLDKVGAKEAGNDSKVSNKSSLTIEVPKSNNCNSTTGVECYAIDIDIPGISELALAEDKVNGAVGTTIIDKDIDSATAGTEMYLVNVDGNEIINVIVPDLYTVSGTVKDGSGTAVPDAIVHIEKPGTEVEFDVQADSSGNYSVSLPASGATPYLIQADKVGYLDTASSLTVTGNIDASAYTVVNAATTTISGTVQIGSTGVDKATVMVEQFGGGFTTTTTNPDGTYTVQVPAGDYKVSAVTDGYTEKFYQVDSKTAVVSTTGGSAASKDVILSTTQSDLSTPPSELVTPQNGGSIEHGTTTGVGLDLPPGALGGSSTDYSVMDKDSSNAPLNTPTTKIIGGEVQEITSFYQTSSSGKVPVQDLDDAAGIEITHTTAELAADGVDTFAEVERMKAAYFDDTARNWAYLPTNITYLGTGADVDKAVIPTSNLSNVGKVIIAGKIDHFSLIGTSLTDPDGLAPKAPTIGTATGGTSSITVTWTAPTQNADNTTLTDGYVFSVYRSTSASGTYLQINTSNIAWATTQYTDSNVSAGTTYYYKVMATDTGGVDSALSSSVSASRTTTPGGGVILPQPTQPETTPTPTTVTPAPTTSRYAIGIMTTTPKAELIKLPNSPTVYSLKNGKLIAIPSAEVFTKSGYKWSDIKIVKSTANYSQTKLIKATGEPTVYEIRNGKRSRIKTGREFLGLGYKWSDVVELSPAEVSAYHTGEPLAVEIKLMKLAGNPTVYEVINSGQAKPFKTAHEFLSKGYKWSEITTVNQADMSKYLAASVKVNSPSLGTLNVREQAGIGNKKIGLIKHNETYPMLAEKDGWYQIQLGAEQTGWVSGEYVIIHN